MAADRGEADSMRRWWRRTHGSGFDLQVETGTGVVSTVAAEVRTAVSAGFDEVVVVVGFLAEGSIERRLLHDHTAESICVAVARIPGASAVLVPVLTAS